MTTVHQISEKLLSWKSRMNEISNEVARLNDELSKLKTKMDAVDDLFGDTSPEDENSVTKPATHQRSTPKFRYSSLAWAQEIKRIFEEKKTFLTFPELRDQLEQGSLRGHYDDGDKAFYNAIARLKSEGYLEKYKNRLVRTEDMKNYQYRVVKGYAMPLASLPPTNRVSPMADEIHSFLAKKNGQPAVRLEIVDHLRQDERFKEALTRNSAGGYNVISRLLGRGEIREAGGLIYSGNANAASVEYSGNVNVVSVEASETSTEKDRRLFGTLGSNHGPRGQ